MPSDESDPVENAKKIIAELAKFSTTLAAKERWLVLNKTDLIYSETLAQLKQRLQVELDWKGEIFEIAAIDKTGCEPLCEQLMQTIEAHREKLIEDESYSEQLEELERKMAFEIRASIEATRRKNREDALEDDYFEDEDWDDD